VADISKLALDADFDIVDDVSENLPEKLFNEWSQVRRIVILNTVAHVLAVD
jgi:hypothetical protein